MKIETGFIIADPCRLIRNCNKNIYDYRCILFKNVAAKQETDFASTKKKKDFNRKIILLTY